NVGWKLYEAHHMRDKEIGEVWVCTLTDEAWSFRRRDGTLVSYPWSTLRLVFAHPDGFLVETGLRPTVVARKPLVNAGLEELFLGRIAKKS
nr:hypothetical protein [Armatimonadota bacterium]